MGNRGRSGCCQRRGGLRVSYTRETTDEGEKRGGGSVPDGDAAR